MSRSPIAAPGRRLGRAGAAIVVCALLLIVDAGPVRAEAASRDPGAGSGRGAAASSSSVTVIGDSLTVGIAEPLRRRLRSDGIVVRAIDAKVGRSTSQGLARLGSVPLGDLVVVGLGTNDIAGGVKVARFAELVTDLVRRVAPRPVVWINGYLARSDAEAERTAAFNQALADAQTREPNLYVLDWAGYMARNTILQARDRVHLTPAGYRARADVVADVIGQVLAPAASSASAGGMEASRAGLSLPQGVEAPSAGSDVDAPVPHRRSRFYTAR